MKPNKSPGDDGIVSEFYQKYWYLIKTELTNVIQTILENNTLAPSQCKAILTLLYKKGEREDIGNWRPISLLNTDYKIITKVLAERVKIVLPKIIHPDQKGFINGRNISDANRLLQDLIKYSDEHEINSSIIFIDYQKAFDRVEWPWALKCLERFNFGPKFRGWINMIYKNAKTCILTNGFRSTYFPISRSMRQGCPISPLIYIIQVEPFACAIRNNEKIIGFPLPGNKTVKFNAYVDDSQIFNRTEESIKETFKLSLKFEGASGAKIHKNKTTGLYIGPWKGKSPEFKEISWTKNSIKTLGVFHGYNIDEHAIWMEKITKIKNCIQVWKTRDLTLRGKILIIKTFVITQIGFQAEMIPVPQYIIKAIDKIIWEFLWDSKQPLVNKQTMFLDPLSGGLNMVNLLHFIQAKQIKSIYKILTTEHENWNAIGKSWLQCLDRKFGIDYFVTKCSSLKKQVIYFTSEFYQQAVYSWVFYQSRLKTPDRTSILKEQLNGNNKILFKNAPLWFDILSRAGFQTIHDIWDIENKSFKTNDVITNRVERRHGNRAYTIIKSAIPSDWVEILKMRNQTQPSNLQKLMINIRTLSLNSNKLKLKCVQNILKDTSFKLQYKDKWEGILREQINWKECWKNSYELPLTNREKQLHWKIIHNAVFTEYKLSLMGRLDGKCHFCFNETEYLTHLFFNCSIIQRVLLWIENKLNTLMNNVGQNRKYFSLKTCITGFEDTNETIRLVWNTVAQLLKWEIWKLRNVSKFEGKRISSLQLIQSLQKKIRNVCHLWEKANIANEKPELVHYFQMLN